MKTIVQTQIIKYPTFWSILNCIKKIFPYSLTVSILNIQKANVASWIPALNLKIRFAL